MYIFDRLRDAIWSENYPTAKGVMNKVMNLDGYFWLGFPMAQMTQYVYHALHEPPTRNTNRRAGTSSDPHKLSRARHGC